MAVPVTFYISQGSTVPSYAMALTHRSGAAVDLTTAVSVNFVMASYFTGTVVNSPATIVAASQGLVSYSWGPNDLLTPGVFSTSWLVTWNTGATTNYPLSSYGTVVVLNNLSIGFPNMASQFNTIRTGTVAPTGATGNNGDFYYNVTTGFFYGPKVGGSWPTGYGTNPALLPLNSFSIPTGNIPMGNNKFTGMSNGVAAGDSATFNQLPVVPAPVASVIPGVVAANMLSYAPNSSTVAVAATGVVYAAAVWLPANTVVNNINFVVGTASVSQTHAWVGLANSSGVSVALSADRGTSVFPASATTAVTIPLTATYQVPTTGIYYVLFSCTASTMPQLVGQAIAPTSAAAYGVSSGTTGVTQQAPASGTFGPPASQATGVPLFWLS